jgi:hypothetical protein
MTVRATMLRVFQQEDINFLLTNRIPRQLLTRFMGWFSKIEHPLVRRLSIATWRLFADQYAALGAAVDAVQAAEPAFEGKIRALVRHFCQAFDDNPVLFSYLLLSQHDQLRKVTQQMANPLTVVRRVIAEALAQQPGDHRDPAVVAAMVMGLVLQVAVERTYGRITVPLTGLADTLASACWRVVRDA